MFLEASFSKANPRSINRHLNIPAYYDNIIRKYATLKMYNFTVFRLQ